MSLSKSDGQKEQLQAEKMGLVDDPKEKSHKKHDDKPEPKDPEGAEPKPDTTKVRQTKFTTDELLSVYHTSKALEDVLSNNPAHLGQVKAINALVKRELAGHKQCTEFTGEPKKCTNSTCEDGLHAA